MKSILITAIIALIWVAANAKPVRVIVSLQIPALQNVTFINSNPSVAWFIKNTYVSAPVFDHTTLIKGAIATQESSL